MNYQMIINAQFIPHLIPIVIGLTTGDTIVALSKRLQILGKLIYRIKVGRGYEQGIFVDNMLAFDLFYRMYGQL